MSILDGVRRHPMVVAVVFVIVVMMGAFVVWKQPKVYVATSTVLFLPQAESAGGYQDTVRLLLPTLAEMLKSPKFFDEQVVPKLSFRATGTKLAEQVHGETVPSTAALKIVAASPNASRAAELSVLTTRSFIESVDTNAVTFKVSDLASVPSKPILPRPAVTMGVASLVGLALGVAASLVWERFFPRLRTANDVAAATGLPVFGVIPGASALCQGPHLAVGNPSLADVEKHLRMIRTSLMFALTQGNHRAVVVSGTHARSGTSTVAGNVAILLAELGLKVVLVDADLRHPVQHKLFGLGNEQGLSSLLVGADPRRLPQATAVENLSVVTAGPPIANDAHETQLYRRVLEVAPQADLIVVDSPTLGGEADVPLLASSVGSILLVVRAQAALVSSLATAVKGLVLMGIRPLGTVLSRSQQPTLTGRKRGIAFFERFNERQLTSKRWSWPYWDVAGRNDNGSAGERVEEASSSPPGQS